MTYGKRVARRRHRRRTAPSAKTATVYRVSSPQPTPTKKRKPQTEVSPSRIKACQWDEIFFPASMQSDFFGYRGRLSEKGEGCCFTFRNRSLDTRITPELEAFLKRFLQLQPLPPPDSFYLPPNGQCCSWSCRNSRFCRHKIRGPIFQKKILWRNYDL